MRFNFSNSLITFLKNLKTTPHPEVSLLVSSLLLIGSILILKLWTTIPMYDYYLRAENVQGNIDTIVTANFDFDFPTYGVLRKTKHSYCETVSIQKDKIVGSSNKAHTYRDFIKNDQLINKIDSACNDLQLKPEDLKSLYFFRIKSGKKISFVQKINIQNPLLIGSACNVLLPNVPNGELKAQGLIVAGLNDSLMDDCYKAFQKRYGWDDDDWIYEYFSAPKYHEENLYFSRNILFFLNNSSQGVGTRTSLDAGSVFGKIILSPFDISQAYYRISYASQSMPKCDIKLNFNTAIKENNDNYSSYVNIKTGLTSIDVATDLSPTFSEYPSWPGHKQTFRYSNIFYLKFSEFENIQFVRMFAITTIITLLLTWMLKSIVGIYKKWKIISRKK